MSLSPASLYGRNLEGVLRAQDFRCGNEDDGGIGRSSSSSPQISSASVKPIRPARVILSKSLFLEVGVRRS